MNKFILILNLGCFFGSQDQKILSEQNESLVIENEIAHIKLYEKIQFKIIIVTLTCLNLFIEKNLFKKINFLNFFSSNIYLYYE